MEIIQGTFEELEEQYKKFWLTSERYLEEEDVEEIYNYKHEGVLVKYKDVRIFLATEDGKYIGRVCACIEHNGVDGFVKGMYIDAGYRNQGRGKVMMDEAEKWFKNQGCKRIFLNVVEGNDGAFRFYKGMGYEIVIKMLKKDI